MNDRSSGACLHNGDEIKISLRRVGDCGGVQLRRLQPVLDGRVAHAYVVGAPVDQEVFVFPHARDDDLIALDAQDVDDGRVGEHLRTGDAGGDYDAFTVN